MPRRLRRNGGNLHFAIHRRHPRGLAIPHHFPHSVGSGGHFEVGLSDNPGLQELLECGVLEVQIERGFFAGDVLSITIEKGSVENQFVRIAVGFFAIAQRGDAHVNGDDQPRRPVVQFFHLGAHFGGQIAPFFE